MARLIIDPQSGIAGDMFIAALIDAGAPGDTVLSVMENTARLLGTCEMEILSLQRNGVNGKQLSLSYTPNDESVVVGKLFEYLDKALDQNNIEEKYREYARRVLLVLSEAEVRAHLVIDHDHMHEHGHVHGHDQEDSHDHHHGHSHTHNHDYHAACLHEAQDILVDIAGSACALQAMDIDLHEVVCLTPVFSGGGMITFSHGTFSVPAPAVKEIVHAFDIPVAEGPVAKELLTPTGAAILAAFGCSWKSRDAWSADVAVHGVKGTGFGTCQFPQSSSIQNGCVVYCQ
ncbi:MAG: DUF111 family protein [Spirochaetales bacterium]|nr:DUF111 family protein [Spirochaetales bacterium]